VTEGRTEVADVRWEVTSVRWEVAEVRWEVADVRCEVADVRWEVAEVRWEVAEVRWEVAEGPVEVAEVPMEMTDGRFALERRREKKDEAPVDFVSPPAANCELPPVEGDGGPPARRSPRAPSSGRASGPVRDHRPRPAT
jgi:2-amino-4-hydroxy-6-hydroxymethyldihydropteridine diphosphokinase